MVHWLGAAVLIIALVGAWFCGAGVARVANPAPRWSLLIMLFAVPTAVFAMAWLLLGRTGALSVFAIVINLMAPTLIWSLICYAGYARARRTAAP